MKRLGLFAALVAFRSVGLSAQPIPQTDWGTFKFERSTGLTSGTLAGHPDSIFAALPGVLADLGLAPKAMVTEGRTLGIKKHRLVRRLGKHPISRFLSCGDGLTGPNADSYYVYLDMRLELGPLPANQTALEMFVAAEAVNVPDGQNVRVGCASTGVFENQLVTRLQGMFRAPT